MDWPVYQSDTLIQSSLTSSHALVCYYVSHGTIQYPLGPYVCVCVCV